MAASTRLSGMLSLPTEVLDEVYGYLDWDSSTSLLPQREDIYSVSLVCQRLRGTVIPALFRTVYLRLKFADATLVEPGLYRLRRLRPDLAKHVRCVVIRPEYEPIKTALTHQELYGTPVEIEHQWDTVEKHYHHRETAHPLVIPGNVSDAANFISRHCELEGHRRSLAERAVARLDRANYALAAWDVCDNMRWSQRMQEDHLSNLLESQRLFKDEVLALARRKREDQIQGRLTKVATSVSTSTSASARTNTTPIAQESLIHLSSDRRFPPDRESRTFVGKLQSGRDALALAIASIPSTVDHLFLNAHQPAPRHSQACRLTLALFAAAIELFGPQLRTVTRSSFQDTIVYDRNDREVETLEASYLNEGVIGNLSALKTLRFGMDQSGRSDGSFRHFSGWQLTSNTITRLELWGHRCYVNDLTDLLGGFPNITFVLCGDLTVNFSPSNPTGRIVPRQFTERPSLIRVAFEIRCLLPMAQVQLHSLKTCSDFNHGEPEISTAGEERFVKREVLDLRERIDDSKAERLLKDYESFLSLWQAEQTECTDQRAQARRFGELCDLALSSRFGS